MVVVDWLKLFVCSWRPLRCCTWWVPRRAANGARRSHPLRLGALRLLLAGVLGQGLVQGLELELELAVGQVLEAPWHSFGLVLERVLELVRGLVQALVPELVPELDSSAGPVLA